MKTRLFTFLVSMLVCCIHLSAKDHIWDRYWETRKYFCDRLNINSSDADADVRVADAFLAMCKDKSFNVVHSIIIDAEGGIMYDGSTVSASATEKLILSSSNLVKKPILFHSVVVYGKKPDRSFQKLMKSVTKLIEKRTDLSYPFAVYPVLCTDRSMGLLVHERDKLISNLVSSSPTVANTVEEESNTQERTPTKASSNSSLPKQTKVAKVNEPDRTSTERKEEVLSYGPSKTYIVNVETSLLVRESPSTNAKKLGNLVNGTRIEVVDLANGWAKMKYGTAYGYVNSSYIQLEEVPEEAASYTGGDAFYRFMYRMCPYAIAVLFVLLIIALSTDADNDDGSALRIVVFFLGFAELLFSAGKSVMDSGTNPWFCEPNEVGWILTIINYFVVVAVLMFQHSVYKGFVADLEIGCFGRILSYVLALMVGIALMFSITNLEFFYVGPVAVFLLWLIMKYVCDVPDAFKLTLWAAVAFGGLAIFFLQMLSLLILGGIVILLIQAFANSGSYSNASSSSNNSSSRGPDVFDDNGTPHFFQGYSGGSHATDEDGRSWFLDPSDLRWKRKN